MRLELSVIRMVLATALGKPAFWLALAVIAAAGLACSGCGFPVPVLVASYLCCGAPACLIGLWRRSRQRRELVRLLDGSLRGRSPVLVSE
ncbi:hypothetical protein JW921_04805, partial [Candidatus Fermentibacterales bacterium]|nr:hypothetical protein [Candidatus Fermentibacterales bacterium]